jgi:phosphatidylserine/phosphatidylglycerophosphate/cardiolipin synthase-like enzyme
MLELERERCIPASNLEVLTPDRYLQDIRLEAHKAKKRIWAQAMAMDARPDTQPIWNILTTASHKGLDTQLHIDSIMAMTSDMAVDKYLFLKKPSERRARQESRQQTDQLLDELYFNGVKITYTNPPEGLQEWYPIKGRDHRKFFIIDDTVYFGGINLEEPNLLAEDFMVKFTDPRITRHLISLFQQFNEHLPLSDFQTIMT